MHWSIHSHGAWLQVSNSLTGIRISCHTCRAGHRRRKLPIKSSCSFKQHWPFHLQLLQEETWKMPSLLHNQLCIFCQWHYIRQTIEPFWFYHAANSNPHLQWPFCQSREKQMHGQSLMIPAIYLSISYYYEIKQKPQPGCIIVSLSLKARMEQTVAHKFIYSWNSSQSGQEGQENNSLL